MLLYLNLFTSTCQLKNPGHIKATIDVNTNIFMRMISMNLMLIVLIAHYFNVCTSFNLQSYIVITPVMIS